MLDPIFVKMRRPAGLLVLDHEVPMLVQPSQVLAAAVEALVAD